MIQPTPGRDVTTLRAPIRLRNAREHARLARRLRQGAELHNALARFERGIRRHNRRCFLRHPPDWRPGAGDWQDVRTHTPPIPTGWSGRRATSTAPGSCRRCAASSARSRPRIRC